MSSFADFLTATERCADQARTMLGFEQEKRQALLSDDMDRLENMIQAQQAAIMKLESLEKLRLEAQEKAGYHNLSADEILKLLDDGPDKESLARQAGELRQTLEDIRFQNDSALEIARMNLQIIESLATGKEQNERQGVYKPVQGSGAKFQGTSSFDKKY
ncbi:MAG: flagellar protein FlgN [Clostridiales bacterium]|nr:flagellar protein FlgN [Clostridiales bacterium]